MRFFDTIGLGQAAEASGMRETRNGSLVVHARAARGGNVQDYLGAEVHRPDLAVVRVYRDADEIFHKDSLKTFGHKAVTLDHPPEPVTARTWKDVARGHTGDEVLRDGEFVKIPMLVADQAAIDAIKAGKRELSVGYQCDLDWTPGTSPSGEDYDARQIRITVDHVAIVDRGRAGPDCRVGDRRPSDAGTMRALPIPQQTEDRTMPDTNRTVMVDGLSVLTTDQGAQAIEKLTRDRDTARTALTEAERVHRTTVEAKDEQIGRLKTEIQTAKDAAPKPEHLDKLVADRAALVTTVKAVDSRIVTDGKSDADLRRAAVAGKHGDDFVKDASDAEIVGMFKAVAKDARATDPLAGVIAGGVQTNDTNSLRAARDKAIADRNARLTGAHRQTAA